ncbi:aldo/keto reductase [uncultured Arcticibacterium sp.]|uniref:aldo/keto reductase n=1 Tax=uncultured Arcticibacterium sp. TaxID=2173042 RepID=UPI0030F990CA
MISKLAIGTVQFGMNYGINNKKGKPSLSAVSEILEYAKSQGIDTLDTAALYGSSEKALGQCDLDGFNIVSKLQPCKEGDFDKNLDSTLKNLNREEIYAYLFHHFSTYLEDDLLMERMMEAKREKRIKKLGFSLYNPAELELLLEKEIKFDIVQVPFSVFDQRFDAQLVKLNSEGVEVHVRSVFLQGLFFMDVKEIPNYFQSIIPKLESLNEYDLKKTSICLNFVLLNPNIDKVVVGIDNLDQLKNNISTLSDSSLVNEMYEELKGYRVDDEMIINPSNWKIK